MTMALPNESVEEVVSVRLFFRADTPLDMLMRNTPPRRRSAVLRNLAEECLAIKELGLHHQVEYPIAPIPPTPANVTPITVSIRFDTDAALDQFVRKTPRQRRIASLRSLAEDYLALRKAGLRIDPVPRQPHALQTAVEARRLPDGSRAQVSGPAVDSPIQWGRAIALDAPTGNGASTAFAALDE